MNNLYIVNDNSYKIKEKKSKPLWKKYLNVKLERTKMLLQLFNYNERISELVLLNVEELEMKNLIEARKRKKALMRNPNLKLEKFIRSKVLIYEDHIYIKHINYAEIRCNICFRILKEKNNKHICYKCKCGVIFEKKKIFNRHICEAKQEMYECEICKKTFGRYDNLTRHIKIHLPKDVKCKLCNYETTRKDHLNKHIGNYIFYIF